MCLVLVNSLNMSSRDMLTVEKVNTCHRDNIHPLYIWSFVEGCRTDSERRGKPRKIWMVWLVCYQPRWSYATDRACTVASDSERPSLLTTTKTSPTLASSIMFGAYLSLRTVLQEGNANHGRRHDIVHEHVSIHREYNGDSLSGRLPWFRIVDWYFENDIRILADICAWWCQAIFTKCYIVCALFEWLT